MVNLDFILKYYSHEEVWRGMKIVQLLREVVEVIFPAGHSVSY